MILFGMSILEHSRRCSFIAVLTETLSRCRLLLIGRRAVQDPQAEYEQLPREHELLSVVSQIVEAADRREDAAKLLASKVFTQMFKVTDSWCAPPAASCSGPVSFAASMRLILDPSLAIGLLMYQFLG